jgi:hypothetical protein
MLYGRAAECAMLNAVLAAVLRGTNPSVLISSAANVVDVASRVELADPAAGHLA